jgi:hypothetical protein
MSHYPPCRTISRRIYQAALAPPQKDTLKGHNYIKDGAWINTLK